MSSIYAWYLIALAFFDNIYRIEGKRGLFFFSFYLMLLEASYQKLNKENRIYLVYATTAYGEKKKS